MAANLLLVEDEEHLAFTLSFNLCEEGYSVKVASSIADAKVARQEQSFDLIVLDVMLPDGSGFDFARTVREEGDITPILVLTAKGAQADVVAGLEAGADGYMVKPFALQELLSRVGAMLRRREWEKKRDLEGEHGGLETFHFGDALINFVRQKVEVGGRPVKVTDLEFRLLRFFVENKNAVVSREQLLEAVWDLPAVTNTRTVDNFLVRLRRVFEKDPGNPDHFLTVRGSGYRFVP